MNFLTESHWVRRKGNRKEQTYRQDRPGCLFQFLSIYWLWVHRQVTETLWNSDHCERKKVNENMKNIYYNSGYITWTWKISPCVYVHGHTYMHYKMTKKAKILGQTTLFITDSCIHQNLEREPSSYLNYIMNRT